MRRLTRHMGLGTSFGDCTSYKCVPLEIKRFFKVQTQTRISQGMQKVVESHEEKNLSKYYILTMNLRLNVKRSYGQAYTRLQYFGQAFVRLRYFGQAYVRLQYSSLKVIRFSKCALSMRFQGRADRWCLNGFRGWCPNGIRSLPVDLQSLEWL